MEHQHDFWLEFESDYPHREYNRCACGHTEYTGTTKFLSNCNTCNPSPIYKDVSKSDWYYDAVMFVTEKGLMIGMDTGIFAPHETLTREQAIMIIARLSGNDYLKYEGQSSFDDVAGNRWSAGAIAWARATGVTQGVGNNKFRTCLASI